ncbi:DUF6764 family protein [Hoyosella subflava]|uniref:DUF6764 family protein n=1 Tax=Hoyosella subflava TaxID=639313 RepID=UPI0003000A36|nr:DUF6764 family protein [Hoyosella subflava]
MSQTAVSTHHRVTRRLALAASGALIAGSVSLLGATTAAAAPVECPAVPGTGPAATSATSSCSATADDSSAAAAFGFDGNAAAAGEMFGLSLAIAADGGTATSAATNFSGPAAIAIGDGATVETWGLNPGLSIGIAGPGATVMVSGTSAPQCMGGPAFAGDFQTGKGCFSDGMNTVPLG